MVLVYIGRVTTTRRDRNTQHKHTSYFDNVKTTLDFSTGASIAFPQSFLVDIIRNVRYGILVERANFPEEWMSKKRTSAQEQGQTNSHTQGLGNPGGGNERQTQRNPGRGNEQHRGTHYGGQPYGVRDIKGWGGQEAATVEGTTHPIPTSLATGAQIGMTNDIPNLKQ